MKKIFLFFGFALLFVSCKEDSPPTPPLLLNWTLFSTSFEDENLALWSNVDTNLVHFSTDVPPAGENKSLELLSSTGPNNISRTFKMPEGKFTYLLSFYGKSSMSGGSLSFGIKSSQRRYTVDIADSTWTEYKGSDTLTAAAGDSLILILSGGISQLVPGKTLFDRISLNYQE